MSKTNAQLCHAWAHGKQEGKTGSLWLHDGILYSYGSHWPLGRLVQVGSETVALLNGESRTRSVSTHRHYRLAADAVSHLRSVDVLTSAMHGHYACEADLFNASAALKLELHHRANRTKAERNARARQKRQEAKRLRDMRDAYPMELELWRKGGPLPLLCTHWNTSADRPPVTLRLVGKYVETSRGAKVPACVCRKVWPLLLAAVAQSKLPFAVPEFAWGDYRGLTLGHDWRVSGLALTVGCHVIPWAEVELIASALGLPRVQTQGGAE